MGGNKLMEQIFNLRFTAKQLTKSSKKSLKNQKLNKDKAKKALEAGNVESAQLYAESSIRCGHESLSYQKLASRLDAVVARLDTQAKMQSVSSSMASIVKQLERTLNTNNLEKVTETMDQFERQFDNMSVQTETIQQAMGQQANMATPESDVNALLSQIADENGLEVSIGLPGTQNLPAASAAVPAAKDDLSNRLAQLQKR